MDEFDGFEENYDALDFDDNQENYDAFDFDDNEENYDALDFDDNEENYDALDFEDNEENFDALDFEDNKENFDALDFEDNEENFEDNEENSDGLDFEDNEEHFDALDFEDNEENVEDSEDNFDALEAEEDFDQDMFMFNAVDKASMIKNSNEKQNLKKNSSEKQNTAMQNEAIAMLLPAQERLKTSKRAEKKQDYELLVATHEEKVVLYPNSFNCPICFDDYKKYEGIILKECLHFFCRECITNSIKFSEEVDVKCPYRNNDYSCTSFISENEIGGLLPPEEYNKRLKRTLQFAEAKTESSFHCKKADCPGWCIVEGSIDVFICTVCSSRNCISCKAIHPAYTCQEYQDSLVVSKGSQGDVKRSETLLRSMVNQGTAMKCPKCSAYVQKADGCDFLQCGVCKMGLCWATKGPRWGPNGPGDITGGCRCKVNGRLCHINCNNCH